MKITIFACGAMRDQAQEALIAVYQKRIKRWRFDIREFVIKGGHSLQPDLLKKQEAERMIEALPDHAYVIALDEKGKDVTSQALAGLIEEIELSGDTKHLIWIIGGADGLHPDIRSRANKTIRFGAQTWPHMLVRIMATEQIYRAQQILGNTPYHREG